VNVQTADIIEHRSIIEKHKASMFGVSKALVISEVITIIDDGAEFCTLFDTFGSFSHET
jgi:hypothetical protein